MRIERSAPDATREQYKVNVGNKIAQALVVRRHDGKEMRAERSVIALGDADLRLPEKGLAVIVAAPRFDADSWKDLFAGEGAQVQRKVILHCRMSRLKHPNYTCWGAISVRPI